MELYAAKRVRKQQEKLKLQQQQEEDIEKQRLVALSSSIEQRHKLDSLFGILEPPTIIYCLCLGSETAGIWWLTSSNSNGSSKDQNQEVLSWEIHRYRLDNKEQNIWSYKGYIEIKYLKNIKQFIYSNLQNGYEYKFTVKVRNINGLSRESDFSNSIYVEPYLPFGWKRVKNKTTDEYFYLNDYSDETSIQRPELNPYFLEECVVMYFHPRERLHLQKIYDEEIYHFEKVYLERFEYILMELGERDWEKRDLLYYYKLYAQNDNELVGFRRFMDLICRLKIEKMNQSFWTIDDELFQDKNKDKRIPKKTSKQQDYYIGEWCVSYHLGEKKWFYFHPSDPNVQWWCMPEEVLYYLPPEDYDRVHNMFNYGMVARFKLQFFEINTSRSGKITDQEFLLFLQILEIEIDQVTFPLFFRSLDVNSSGYLEFNEFMLLMCDVNEKKSSLLYQNIFDQFSQSQYLRQLCHEGPILIPKKLKKKILYRGKSGQIKDEEEDVEDDRHEDHRHGEEEKYNNLNDNQRYQKKKSIIKGKKKQRKDQYIQPETPSTTQSKPPPRSSSSSSQPSWFERFNCFRKSAKISAIQSKILELTAINKPTGPHGRYCFCGCRGNLPR